MANFVTSLRTARAQVIIDSIDAGAAAGYIEYFAAPKPATAGLALSGQTLIGKTLFSDPSGTVANGVITFSPISDDLSIDNTGIVSWARISDSDGNAVIDLTVGLAGSGSDIIADDVNATAGGVIKITSGAYTEGNI